MITKLQLEFSKLKNIRDVDINHLKDISLVVIDREKSVPERIISFIEQIDNPYLFKVGNTPVKIGFTPNAPTFQKSLEGILTKNT